jgi:hypothetical protein
MYQRKNKVEVTAPNLPEEAKPETPVVDKIEGQSVVETVRFDKVIIYFPKFFLSTDKELELLRKDMPVNKKPTPLVVRDMFRKFWWSIKRNEMKIFDKEVGEYLLAKFGFLIRVQPHEIDKYKKIQEEKEYKCHVCEEGKFETNNLGAYQQHMKKHNLSPEAQAMIASMETAKADSIVNSAQDMIEGARSQIDQYAGAPIGGTYNNPAVDSDGVEWVGQGSVKRQGMKLRPKFGAAGVFRGGVQ